VIAVVGVVVRCWPRGALWLDEAQSVAIARCPLGDTVGALREDGAPPLYSALLHVWTLSAGRGDVAVRMLSVMISVAFACMVTFAARLLAGRRAAFSTLVLVASSSFAVRYASETRMYALVMLEVTLALLAVRGGLRRTSFGRLVLVGLTTAALPYTYYWYVLGIGERRWRWRSSSQSTGSRGDGDRS